MPRLRKPGINVAHGKQRERVAFEPRAENGCDRHQGKQRINSPLSEPGADVHPGRHFRALGRGKDCPPTHARHCQRKHAHAEQLVRPTAEIINRRIDARLRAADAHDVSDNHEQRGEPVKEPRGRAVALNNNEWMSILASYDGLGMLIASRSGACCRSPGRSVNCAAAEKARACISNVTISPAMPDAAKIMATIMN